MHLADTLSRAYLPTEGNPQDREFAYINMASYLPIAEDRLEEIRRETRNNPSLQELKSVITHRWLEDKSKIAPQVHPFFSILDELTIQDVPQSLRPMIKTKLHSFHMGIDACLRRARGSVFCPGFSAEIKQMIETCETCRKFGDVERMKPFVAGKKTWEKAMVKERLHERSYTVETANGDTYRRNRQHMRKTKESMDNPCAPVEQPQRHASSLPDTLQVKSREIHQTRERTAQQAETPSAMPDGVQHKAVPDHQTIPDHISTRSRHATKPPAWLKDYIR